MPPSILFVNRVFPPDRGATGRVLADVAERAVARGWRVTVLADGSGEDTAWRGVRVVRTGRGGGRPGARGYPAALARLVARGLTLPRHDVVVTMTDPPLLALGGPLLAARHRAAALHWCQDLYPALLPVLGFGVPKPLLAGARAAMGRALRRHDGVVAIGRCMAARLRGMGVAADRLTVLPNWADPGIRPLPRDDSRLRRELALGDRFTVACSGNFGLAHPMGAVLDAAALLPEVAFLLVGDGRGHDRVRGAVAERALGNVHLPPFQPGERLADTLAAADLHLATMAAGAAGLLVPCKVAGVLAAGRPCLFLGPAECEAARGIAEHRCGAVLDPGDGAALAATVRAYAADPCRAAEEGGRALRAATAAGGADAAAERFLALAAGLTRPAAMAWPAALGGVRHG